MGGVPTPLGGTPVDQIAVFNTAIAVVQAKVGFANSGGVIIVPEGQWYIASDIVLPDGVRLRGESPSASRIRAITGYSGTAMVRNSVNSQEYFWVEDLYIDGRGFAPIGVQFDTVFVNSGIRRCVLTNHTVNGLKILTTVIAGGSGPISVDDVWAVSSGADCVLVSGSVQAWFRNLTAEHPGVGFSCVQVTGNGAANGLSFDSVHLESSTNLTTNGIVIDGCFNVRIRNVSAGGSKPVTDIVQLTNASGSIANVTVDGVTGSSAGTAVHDVVNGVTVPLTQIAGSKYYCPRYVMPDALATRSTLTVGASPYTYQNLTGRPVRLVITGGNISALDYSRDNATFDSLMAVADSLLVPVAPSDYLRVTYSGAAPVIARYLVTW